MYFNTLVPLFLRYLALYAYKPQKADELELRKGEMYRVTEKCQDGWFKGTSLRTAASGVFPGNYVTPVSRSVDSESGLRWWSILWWDSFPRALVILISRWKEAAVVLQVGYLVLKRISLCPRRKSEHNMRTEHKFNLYSIINVYALLSDYVPLSCLHHNAVVVLTQWLCTITIFNGNF